MISNKKYLNFKCNPTNFISSGFLIFSLYSLSVGYIKKAELLELQKSYRWNKFQLKIDLEEGNVKTIYDCPEVKSLASRLYGQHMISNLELQLQGVATTTIGNESRQQVKYKPLPQPPIEDPVPGLPPIVQDYLNIQDWKQEYQNRITRHRKVCQLYPDKPHLFDEWRNNGPHMQANTYSLYDPKHKVIYCELPKCGCTNWKMTLRRMSMLEDLKEGEIVEDAGTWTYGKDNGRRRRKRSPGKKNKKIVTGNEDLDSAINNQTKTPPELSNLMTDEEDEPSEISNLQDLDEEINKNLNEAGVIEGSNYLPNGQQKMVDGEMVFVDREHLGRFGKYVLEWTLPAEERIKMYSNSTYFKFIFVRHPLERILSGYRDKVQRYFLNRSLFYGLRDQSFKDQKDLQYKELDVHGFQIFLRYLIHRGISVYGGGTVRHWKRYYDLCRTCAIDWDFIGKMDSIFEDSEYVMEKAGVKGRLHYGAHSKTTNYEKLIRYRTALGNEPRFKLVLRFLAYVP